VLLGGRPVYACSVLAVDVHAEPIATVGGVGASTRRGVRDALAALLAKAAPELGARPEELETVDGTVRVRAEPDPLVPNPGDGLDGCRHTMTNVGPDGKVAEPARCGEGRSCFERR
jgi:hypothetical protein